MADPRSLLPSDPAVAASLAHCHEVTRTAARNFYYGLRLTPEPRRSALYAVYAFMRACDDLVDAEDRPTPAQRDAALARVEAFRSRMAHVLDGGDLPDEPAGQSIWPAFRHVMQAFPIDPAHLHAMLDGQRDDLTTTHYRTFEQLYGYCYRVASVVGLVCVAVWGVTEPAKLPDARQLAEYRGIAFQLTNILRDVAEDARRGRVYLPADELAHYGLTERDLTAAAAASEPGAAFDRFMQFQVERARSYYEMSAPLDRMIRADCRATSWALCRIYSRLLGRIAARPRRVLTRRVRLSPLQKALIALRATWMRPA